MTKPNPACQHTKEFIAKRERSARGLGIVGGSYCENGVVYVADVDGVKYVGETALSLLLSLQMRVQNKKPRGARGFWRACDDAKAVSFRVIAVIACKQQRHEFADAVINQMRASGCDARRTRGYELTEEERRAKRAQRHTAEAKARIAVFRTGKKHSAETCRKISQTRKERGIKPSPLTKEKMRASNIATWSKKTPAELKAHGQKCHAARAKNG